MMKSWFVKILCVALCMIMSLEFYNLPAMAVNENRSIPISDGEIIEALQNAQIVDPEEDSQFVLHNLDIQSETELEAEERTVLSEIESDMKVTAASDDIPGDAIIYALQAEEKLPVGTANGNFGTTTKKCCPTIPYERNSSAAKSYPGAPSGSYYSNSQISAFTELLQFALYVNGFGDGSINGIWWQVLLLFTGIGMFLLPFWCVQ